MAKKDINDSDAFFGGFEAVLDSLSSAENKPLKGVTSPGMPEEDEEEYRDPKKVTQVEEEEEDPIVDPEVVKGELDDEEEEEEEEIEEPKKTGKIKKVEEEEEDSLSEYEEDITSFVSERLEEELGFEFGKENKPKSVKDILDFVAALVEENSKPTFASEEMEKLNQYVANGGDLTKYIETAYGDTDLEKLDLTEERAQKKVIYENLQRLGYKEDRIKKMIDRYEDAGTLEEEADDAFAELKEYRQKESEALLANQEKERKQARERQQKFITDVQTSVEKMDSIRGIPVTAKEKQQLMDYMFKPEADGRTKYQKEYAKDYKNLIESAYFTMKGETLLNKINKKATSQAARNLQEKLASKGKRVKNSGGQDTYGTGSWDAVVSQLKRPNF